MIAGDYLYTTRTTRCSKALCGFVDTFLECGGVLDVVVRSKADLTFKLPSGPSFESPRQITQLRY